MNNKIRFAHLADLHLGAYREKKLTQLNFLTFQKAVLKIIENSIDFCVFSGDIFNNAMPPIELVTQVVEEFMKLKKMDIPVYIIGGSHDYSVSGKSFIELLDSAGVFTNVAKLEYIDNNKLRIIPTVDKKTGASIYGVVGKKNELEKNIYSKLEHLNLNSDNLNVFLFHTTLNDFKPKFMKNHDAKITTSMLPQGFDYYAGGHIHTFMKGEYSNGLIVYSGCLFPNNFSELRSENPQFNICEYDKNSSKIKVENVSINTYDKEYIEIKIDNLNPVECRNFIIEEIDKCEIGGKLVLLEISGSVDGKIIDIQLTSIIKNLYSKGAFFVLKNTYKLKSSLIEQISVIKSDNIDKLEEEIIVSSLKDRDDKDNEYKKVKNLLNLELVKIEGEKVAQFESRCLDDIKKALNG